MKTIAVDEATAKLLDKLTASSGSRRSRSALVRAAVRQYAARQRNQQNVANDDAVFRKHRKRLARDARALIAEQARP
jgi:predicted transcriptional regulator